MLLARNVLAEGAVGPVTLITKAIETTSIIAINLYGYAAGGGGGGHLHFFVHKKLDPSSFYSHIWVKPKIGVILHQISVPRT